MSVLISRHMERAFTTLWRWASRYRGRDRSDLWTGKPHEYTLLSYYALREKDLPGLLREACALESMHPVETLISLLERRLDNVVFRMGFAAGIPEARRLIAHGHILVNRYRPTNIRMSLWPGDVVHFTLTPCDQRSISHRLRSRQLPSYLQYLNPCTTDGGMMLSLPNLGHSPFAICKAHFNPTRTSSEPVPGGIHG
jgi:ribosomal protein S4